MTFPEKLFKPRSYTHQDYLQWQGDWELINGYPYAMAPSPKRTHQWFGKTFIKKVELLIETACSKCKCQAYYELDWVINKDTVVRPDCSVVCDGSKEDFITKPPVMIVEISSLSTKLHDRNIKFKLYEMRGVKYYIIADTDKKNVLAFELVKGKYKPKKDNLFTLDKKCKIDFDIYSLWESM